MNWVESIHTSKSPIFYTKLIWQNWRNYRIRSNIWNSWHNLLYLKQTTGGCLHLKLNKQGKNDERVTHKANQWWCCYCTEHCASFHSVVPTGGKLCILPVVCDNEVANDVEGWEEENTNLLGKTEGEKRVLTVNTRLYKKTLHNIIFLTLWILKGCTPWFIVLLRLWSHRIWIR